MPGAGERRIAAAVVAVVAGASVLGCGDGATKGRVAFSQVEVQAYLEREVTRTLPGLDVGAATCPPQLPAQTGGTVTCTVSVERVSLDYEVERLAGERFEARPQRPIVLVRDIVASVRSKLDAPSADVRCGDAPVLQPAPGQDVPCEVLGAGPPRTALVRVAADGSVTIVDP